MKPLVGKTGFEPATTRPLAWYATFDSRWDYFQEEGFTLIGAVARGLMRFNINANINVKIT